MLRREVHHYRLTVFRYALSHFRFRLEPSSEVEEETNVSIPETKVSQVECDVSQPSGAGLTLPELLHSYLPPAFAQETALSEQLSFSRTLQSARLPKHTSLKRLHTLGTVT